jgi:hypothetical protein
MPALSATHAALRHKSSPQVPRKFRCRTAAPGATNGCEVFPALLMHRAAYISVMGAVANDSGSRTGLR